MKGLVIFLILCFIGFKVSNELHRSEDESGENLGSGKKDSANRGGYFPGSGSFGSGSSGGGSAREYSGPGALPPGVYDPLYDYNMDGTIDEEELLYQMDEFERMSRFEDGDEFEDDDEFEDGDEFDDDDE